MPLPWTPFCFMSLLNVFSKSHKQFKQEHKAALQENVPKTTVQLSGLLFVCIPQEYNASFVVNDSQTVSIFVPAKPSAHAEKKQ